jgi:hypothetical protein
VLKMFESFAQDLMAKLCPKSGGSEDELGASMMMNLAEWTGLAKTHPDSWYYRQQMECEECGEVEREPIHVWMWRLLVGLPEEE